MTRLISKTLLGASLLAGLTLAGQAFAEDAITVANLSYRTGPFAATGTPLMNGQRDYITMLNERDGGVNGVKLVYEECETGYNTEKGAECYEKTKATSIVTQPWSTGITLQVLPKTNVDKVPILAPGYGFSPMADGKVFQWAFNPPASYWDGASMILKAISDGNLENLKGKKIVLLHLDAPYGKEPIPLLQAYAEKHGFTFLPIPVGVKEMQNQSAQWLQIRRERPDFVLMWGWGAMNAGALAEAAKTKFPMDKFVGIWWSGHDGDMKSVGRSRQGLPVDLVEFSGLRLQSDEGHQAARRRSRQFAAAARRVRLRLLPARRGDLDVRGRGHQGGAGAFQHQGGERRAVALGA